MAEREPEPTSGKPESWRNILLSKPGASNWCPDFTSSVINEYPWEVCIFLASIPPSAQSIHYSCTQSNCNATIELELCRPQHVPTCSGCELFGPDPSRVKELVKNKEIPLLRLKRSPSGQYCLDVESRDFSSRYIAVSHVWTGGLGNPRENKVHLCQLEQIASSGRRIRRTINSTRQAPWLLALLGFLKRKLWKGEMELFWFDTLCVPVREYEDGGGQETDESRELRGLAIDRMTQIYGGSYSVLVLDPELRRLNSQNISFDEFYGRLIRSDWMRRCWTYQEAAMASRLFVALENELRYVTEERRSIKESCEQDSPLRFESIITPQELHIRDQLTRWISQMPAPYLYDIEGIRELMTGSDSSAFVRIWNNLVARTTSHVGDRYLILAMMLNLVPGGLLPIPHEQKLRVIFNSLDRFPMAFLFNNEFSGTDWLPTTMKSRLSANAGSLFRDPTQPNQLVFNYDSAHEVSDREGPDSEGSGSAGSGSAGSDREGPDSEGPDSEGPDSGGSGSEGSGSESSESYHVYTFQRRRRQCSSFSLAVDGQSCAFDVDCDIPSAKVFILLVSIKPVLENGKLVATNGTLFVPQQCSADRKVWSLEYYRAIRILPRPQRSSNAITLQDDLLQDPTTRFLVRSEISGVPFLQVHRSAEERENPGTMIGMKSLMDIAALRHLLCLLYCGIMTAIALTHNPVGFGPGWVVFIWEYWAFDVCLSAWFVELPARRHGDRIMHVRWLDRLTPGWPTIVRRSRRGPLRINHGLKMTILRLVLGGVLVVVGILGRRKRDVRWLTAWGFFMIFEVGTRWFAEYMHLVYWKREGSEGHHLEREIYRASRMTRWCRQLKRSMMPSTTGQGIADSRELADRGPA